MRNQIIKNQKGFAQIILMVLLVLAIAGVGAYYFLNRQYTTALNPAGGSIGVQYQQQYQQAVQGVNQIKDGSGLNAASASLDSTDTTQIDAQLNQLNSDSSSFQ